MVIIFFIRMTKLKKRIYNHRMTSSKVLIRIEKLQNKEILTDYKENDTAVIPPVLCRTINE
jgi:hypothetical protein